VYLNGRLVGRLLKEPTGAVAFHYDESWLAWEHAIPVSLSLPLREDGYRGNAVVAVFENLLPDSETLRRRVAERVGAAGTDAWSLLTVIGRDCVGALQFVPADHGDAPDDTATLDGEVVNDEAIERRLESLSDAPLGLRADDDFRISIAGVQEKTALLWHDGRWLRPRGTAPTTHIFKTQIGRLPNGMDLSHSVETEYYCLALASAFGLPVNDAVIRTFGRTTALVIERFDRQWTRDGRLLRVMQEDCCQALGVPPTRKYQSEGGPGVAELLDLLKGSDTPAEDQKMLLKAQILFWLIGATDGHAKNFSIRLGPGGTFHLTPLYDVLTAEPSHAASGAGRRRMKLAMSLGRSRHYRLDEIQGRHVAQTAQQAGVAKAVVRAAIDEMHDAAATAPARVEAIVTTDVLRGIHAAVMEAMQARLPRLREATVG
jgi:serine/threonine-protein kinase HipA